MLTEYVCGSNDGLLFYFVQNGYFYIHPIRPALVWCGKTDSCNSSVSKINLRENTAPGRARGMFKLQELLVESQRQTQKGKGDKSK